jgi:hypothetical protein
MTTMKKVQSIEVMDILENFGDPGVLDPPEPVDVWLLEKYLKPLYNPEKKALAMVVGASGVNEARILREFHRRNYSLDDLKVAGCTLHALKPGGDSEKDYAVFFGGLISGNAADKSIWMLPMGYFSQQGYDLISIRHPDLVDEKKWEAVFHNGILHLKDNGLLIAALNGADIPHYKPFSERLKRFGAHSVFTTETGLTYENTGYDQLQYIEIFRKGK